MQMNYSYLATYMQLWHRLCMIASLYLDLILISRGCWYLGNLLSSLVILKLALATNFSFKLVIPSKVLQLLETPNQPSSSSCSTSFFIKSVTLTFLSSLHLPS